MEDIYKLKINQTVEVSCNILEYYVTRVPGGWIYTQFTSMNGDTGHLFPIFVPYIKEKNNGMF